MDTNLRGDDEVQTTVVCVAHAIHSYMLANVCGSALQARTGRSAVFKYARCLGNHGIDRHIRDITAVTL
jgi:hypothetical protein